MTPDEAITAREFDAVVDSLRSELRSVAAAIEAGNERSSREHSEVRADLRGLRDSMVTRNDFGAFKQHVYARLDQHDADLERRRGADRLATRLAAIVIGAASVGAAAVAIVGFVLRAAGG